MPHEIGDRSHIHSFGNHFRAEGVPQIIGTNPPGNTGALQSSIPSTVKVDNPFAPMMYKIDIPTGVILQFPCLKYRHKRFLDGHLTPRGIEIFARPVYAQNPALYIYVIPSQA